MGFESLFGNLSTMIALAVSVPFVLIAMGLAYVAWRSGRKAKFSRNWTTTMGRIVAADIQPRTSRNSRGSETTAYYPQVNYEYTVTSQRYLGNRFNFGMETGYGWVGAAEKIVAKYPVGGMVEVYYNPDDPSQAVLERTGGTSSKILWIVAAGILVILVAVLAFTGVIMGAVGQFIPSLPK